MQRGINTEDGVGEIKEEQYLENNKNIVNLFKIHVTSNIYKYYVPVQVDKGSVIQSQQFSRTRLSLKKPTMVKDFLNKILPMAKHLIWTRFYF